jgi:hypothetical protein
MAGYRCAGHVHSYERTNPMLNYTSNSCGTTHVLIGARPLVPLFEYSDVPSWPVVQSSTYKSICEPPQT